MPKLNIRVMIIFGILMGSLLGCGDGDENKPKADLSQPLGATVGPIPTLNILAACDESYLDDWVEVGDTAIERFISDSRNGVQNSQDNNRIAANNTLRNLIQQRDLLSARAMPFCLQAFVEPMLNNMQLVIDEFQRFVNGDIDSSVFSDNVTEPLNNLENQHQNFYKQIAVLWEEN